MCKVSNQLKLCTCNDVGKEPETHYWILYKYQVSNWLTVGLLMLPIEFSPDVEQYNRDTLRHLLNEKNCFDFDVQLEEKDRLELRLHVEAEQEQHLRSKDDALGSKFVSYNYDYKNGKWMDAKENPFHNDLTEKAQGKIVNAFEKDGS